MIKTFWNEDNYNHETDGKVKNVNGGFMFVPYMHGLKDPIYKKYIKEKLAELGYTDKRRLFNI